MSKEEVERIFFELMPKDPSDSDNEKLDALVAGGWRALYAAAFGQSFVDILAPHHAEAIEWHWESRKSFLIGGKPDYWAYFPIWSRGHMKSTIARRIAVADALLSVWAKQPAYILYVSRTAGQVADHAGAVENLIASQEIKAICPNLSKVKKSEAGTSKGYRALFMNTQANVVFRFAGLDEGLAGGNVEGVRPTFQILDDIDGREESVTISEGRFNKLTKEILPMRQSNTLVFFAQNLISRFSVMYRIQSGHARVLTSRKPTKPIPALLNPVYAEKTVGGITKDYVVSGVPTWAFYNIERCNEEIDTGGGLAAFETENQHNVKQSSEGLVHKKYNDAVHAISYSQLASRFGSPDAWKQWYKVAFSDWARTKTHFHANVAGYVAVSSQNSPIPGITVIVPFSFAKDTSPEDVAVRLLSSLTPEAYEGVSWQSLVNDAWKRTNAEQHYQSTSERLSFATGYYKSLIPRYSRTVLSAYNVAAAVNSHSEDKVREMFNEGFGFSFIPANPANHDALEDIDEAMRVDYNEPHLFIPAINGYTRFYVLCPDDETQTPEIIDGFTVYPPMPFPESLDGAELHDSDLFRFQMANRRFADPKLIASGEETDKMLKLFDDYGQGLQMIYFKKLLSNIPLSKTEKIELHLSPQIRENVLAEMEQSPEKDALFNRRRLELAQLDKQSKKSVRGASLNRFSRR